MNIRALREQFDSIQLRTLAKWDEDDDGYDREEFVTKVVTDEEDDDGRYIDENYENYGMPAEYNYGVCFHMKGHSEQRFSWQFDVNSPAMARLVARLLARELGGTTPWPVLDLMVWPEWHNKPPYQEDPDSLFSRPEGALHSRKEPT